MGEDRYVVRHEARSMVVRFDEDGSESIYGVANSEEKARKIAEAENRRMAALKAED